MFLQHGEDPQALQQGFRALVDKYSVAAADEQQVIIDFSRRILAGQHRQHLRIPFSAGIAAVHQGTSGAIRGARCANGRA